MSPINHRSLFFVAVVFAATSAHAMPKRNSFNAIFEIFVPQMGLIREINESMEEQRRTEREHEIEERARILEERNRALERELDLVKKDMIDRAQDLKDMADREQLTSDQKVELGVALFSHKACLKEASSRDRIKHCYQTFKIKFDEITDTW